MSRYDIYEGKEHDATALRAMAAAARERSRESFARSDTDGFLSQWASDTTARQLEDQAVIAERGGLGLFQGLYQGEQRIPAKIVRVPDKFRPWLTKALWLVREDARARCGGRKWIPVGERSRVQKDLRLCERLELAPAKCELMTHPGAKQTGLAGCANAFVGQVRTGDEWGMDARIAPQGAR